MDSQLTVGKARESKHCSKQRLGRNRNFLNLKVHHFFWCSHMFLKTQVGIICFHFGDRESKRFADGEQDICSCACWAVLRVSMFADNRVALYLRTCPPWCSQSSWDQSVVLTLPFNLKGKGAYFLVLVVCFLGLSNNIGEMPWNMSQTRKFSYMFETKRDILEVILCYVVCFRTYNYWYFLSLITGYRHLFQFEN